MDTEPTGDTVDELRQRLNNMKRLMAERQRTGDIDEGRRSNAVGIIDGSFLSVVFGVALVVIITVSVYAFYNLYHAILKKFPSHHEEL
ncbi:uncharacterized protein LOC123006775 [Tribolium madens]|uniref:uncharacterized protein LOC123006775 n=1 Tax=Tribolium madens TaxID=41895 RepID=UPI001CF76479|nr:uncharacterized protein LOC123006775 [Tribolium madens]